MSLHEPGRTPGARSTPLLIALAMTLALASVGCGSGSVDDPTPVPTLQPTAQHTAKTIVGMASTDLAVGDNRVVFGVIVQGEGALRDEQVQVKTFYLTASGPEGPMQTAPATFRRWPGGSGGAYVANLTFDKPGEWGLGIEAPQPDNSLIKASAKVMVKESSSTPSIGSAAPRSRNKTAGDISDLAELTTDTNPDPDLYRMTVTDALDAGISLLVSFATPAYCHTATCGPQVDVLKQLKDTYEGRVNVIHVEVYDNLAEIRDAGIEVGRLTPAMAEWGLASEPWTFVVDGEGIVRAKYEGFVGEDELMAAIDDTLGQ